MKIAILNDTHCGIRNSSDIFLENAAKFYREVFFPYCDKHGITQILHLGDYYDNRKQLNIKALHNNRKNFLEPMRERKMIMDIIPGNHDTYFKNTNDVNSLKEALGFFVNEINIINKAKVLEYGGTKFAMLPWITKENHDESMNFIKTCRADILCGHLELNGFNLMPGVVNKGGMEPSVFERFEMVLSGHFHTKSNKGNILYLGSQLEFFWSDAHDSKFFHVFDTSTREMESIHNPHTLFEKILYDDTQFDYSKEDLSHLDDKFVKVLVVEKKDTYAFDMFIERINQQKIHELKIGENFSEFLGENIEDESVSIEETEELMDTYIDAVDTNLDKDRIKKEMRDLHVQAQSLEIV